MCVKEGEAPIGQGQSQIQPCHAPEIGLGMGYHTQPKSWVPGKLLAPFILGNRISRGTSISSQSWGSVSPPLFRYLNSHQWWRGHHLSPDYKGSLGREEGLLQGECILLDSSPWPEGLQLPRAGPMPVPNYHLWATFRGHPADPALGIRRD